MCRRSISGVSRGRLSPSDASRSSSRPPSSATTPTTTRHESYTGFVPGPNSDWLADHDADDTDQVLALDDGEDEFGLPTIANLRKKAGRRTDRTPSDSNRAPLPFTHTRPPNTSLEPTAVDNGDIAEERGLPQYPSAKKAEGKILRPQYKDILRDPANSLHLISHAAMSPDASSKDREAHDARIGRINKFKRVLQMSSVPNNELRDLAWSGVPQEVRAMSWQILLNYLPLNAERRVATLERKRKEYQEGVHQVFEQGPSEVMSPRLGARPPKQGSGRGLDEVLWHQISIDVPRTNPHLELYSYEATQRSLERILYVWAIRHPASGYVQGINDLVTPFWQVFLASYITDADIESGMDPGQLPKPVLDAVEADTFWCLTKLLDGVQDNYIVAQPGITRQVGALRDLTTRIDERLAKHLDSEGIEFIQFSFRWMNCLLMRELSVRSTIRMWDTYLVSP